MQMLQQHNLTALHEPNVLNHTQKLPVRKADLKFEFLHTWLPPTPRHASTKAPLLLLIAVSIHNYVTNTLVWEQLPLLHRLEGPTPCQTAPTPQDIHTHATAGGLDLPAQL